MNPLNYNASPDHLRGLIAQFGVSSNGAARLVGSQERIFRKYLTGKVNPPFSIVFCLQFYADNPGIVSEYSKILNDHYQKGLNNE